MEVYYDRPVIGLDLPIITLETNVHKERPAEEQIMRVKTFVEMLS